ncbi:MAG: L-fucose/L-arabinose isomerase family protein [Anaerolineae bacterium]
MFSQKTTFALFFGNRGFFPGSLIAAARETMVKVLEGLGHKVLIMPADATRYGAVETVEEGQKYAAWLQTHKGEFGGVILCLPNFGDENGALAALKACGVPILVQAYPDEMDKMGPATRRDAFCGKVSITDVFTQYGLKYTVLKPHTVHPSSPRFAANVDYFDRMCRVVSGMQEIVVGAIGARTTAFKTVRIDEIALQRHKIGVETLDLSEVFFRMGKLKPEDKAYANKANTLKAYTNWQGTPEKAFDNIVRLSVVLDALIAEYKMDAMSLRCWVELQSQLGISPCVLLSELNNRGIPSSCELDLGNAVTMRALALASGGPATCLDWNNNYEDDDDRCILFHCGPVPKSMMTNAGRISDHAILANSVGAGNAFGCDVGRIAPGGFTFGSMVTEAGQLRFYLGKGEFTGQPIPDDYFGCAGVARIDKLQDVMLHVCKGGQRHHVSVTPGDVVAPVVEAMTHYLGYQVSIPQEQS